MSFSAPSPAPVAMPQAPATAMSPAAPQGKKPGAKAPTPTVLAQADTPGVGQTQQKTLLGT